MRDNMPGAPPHGVAAPDVIAYVLADLALILIAARIVGQIFVWLKQPRIVGEIVAGVLIGPTIIGGHLAAQVPKKPPIEGAGLVGDLYPFQAFGFLNLVGQVGLVFFMFLVGLELDQRLLKGRGRQILVMSVAAVAAPVALGFFVGAVLDGSTWKPEGVSFTTFSLFLGAGLSVTAFPVMARILQEKGLLATDMGAVGVGAAAVVTVLMFLMIAAASASAKGSGVAGDVGVKFLLTLALIAGLLACRPLMALLLRTVDERRHLGTIIAVMLALALATGLAADRVGINALVGGFLFGAAVPASRSLAETVIERMQDPVVLFFLPVFLAVSGLRTDFRLVDSGLIPGLLLFLALMIIGKWGVGYLAGRAVGLRDAQAHTLGVLLNCRGLLILVVGLIGLQLGVITKEMQVVFVVGAIVTTLMTGPLVDFFLAKEEPAPPEVDRQTSGIAILNA